MFVKNIIKYVCSFAGMNDVLYYLNDECEINSEIKEKLFDLLVAFNVANNDIAINYIPIKNIVKISCKDNKIMFRNLSENPILEIYSIKKDGNKISEYSIVCDGIILERGDYEIEFSIFPNDLTIDGEINYYTKMTEIIFAQLVLSEYMFLKGYNDEANNWDKKFKEQLRGVLRVKKNISIPKRRWL